MSEHDTGTLGIQRAFKAFSAACWLWKQAAAWCSASRRVRTTARSACASWNQRRASRRGAFIQCYSFLLNDPPQASLCHALKLLRGIHQNLRRSRNLPEIGHHIAQPVQERAVCTLDDYEVIVAVLVCFAARP